jgi:hypothetical protein
VKDTEESSPTSPEVAEHYRDVGRSLKRDAFLQQLAQKPLTARIYEQYAAIARRAAIAEELNPKRVERGCGICGGTTKCVAV